MGAGIAYGLVSSMQEKNRKNPADGLIILDGSFKQYRESSSNSMDSSLQRLARTGRYLTDLAGRRGWEKRHRLMQQTYQDVNGEPLNKKYSTIGQQLSETLYNSWGRGGLSNTRGGVSDVSVLAKLLDTYDRYMPAMLSLEARAISGQKDAAFTTVDDAYGSLDLPIIHFGATGMGGDFLMSGIYSVTKSGSRDVTLNILEDHGHLDVIIGERASELVYEPIYRWISNMQSDED